MLNLGHYCLGGPPLQSYSKTKICSKGHIITFTSIICCLDYQLLILKLNLDFLITTDLIY